MANWQGTLVPNSGVVEKVYFNTNLSVDEVLSIFSTLDYGDIGVYYPLASPLSQIGLMIVNNEGIFGIVNEYNEFIYFISVDPGLGFVGWNPDFNGIIEVNNEVSSELNGLSIGIQNDKITSLFSITPFTSGEETTADKLQKLIDNKQLIVDSVNAKAGTSYDIHSKPSDIADTITNIETGGGTNTSDATATASDILQGKTAYTADGKVEGTIETYSGDMTEGAISNLQTKDVTPLTSEQEILPDSGYDGLEKVNVRAIPSEYIIPSGELEINDNGTYDTTQYASVNVNVESSGTSENILQKKIDSTGARGLFSNWDDYYLDEYTDTLDFSNVKYMDEMFSYCVLLKSVPSISTISCISMYSMFYDCRYIEECKPFITNNVTDMSSMFSGCMKLNYIPVADGIFNTANVTNMNGMFSNCESLKNPPGFNTSNVTNMGYMFHNCKAMTKTSRLDTSSCTNMGSMFYGCNALETIDITYYNISSTPSAGNFVNNCSALKSLIIRGFGENYVLNTTSFTNSGIASGTGYIYVPSAMVDTLKSATNWSTYADQIRALEDYTVDGTTTGELDSTKI